MDIVYFDLILGLYFLITNVNLNIFDKMFMTELLEFVLLLASIVIKKRIVIKKTNILFE